MLKYREDTYHNTATLFPSSGFLTRVAISEINNCLKTRSFVMIA